MRNKIKLMAIAFGVLFISGPVESQSMNTNSCDKGLCLCTNGTCGYPCSNGTCTPLSCTSCPSKVSQFTGEPGVIYSLPEGTLFTCRSQKGLVQQETAPVQVHGKQFEYQVCPVGPAEVVSKESSFETKRGIIYSFAPGTAFVCEPMKQPPQRITAPIKVEGLPAEYWVCPSSSASDTRAHP